MATCKAPLQTYKDDGKYQVKKFIRGYALSQPSGRTSPPFLQSDDKFKYENDSPQACYEDIGQSRYEIDSMACSNGKKDASFDRGDVVDNSFCNSEASGDFPSEIQRNEHILDQKMDELKNFNVESKELDNIEKEILDHQQNIQRLMDERKELVVSRLQRRFEKILLRQQAAGLRRRSRQVQDDLTSDLVWLDRLLALEGEEEGGQINDVKKILDEVLQREKRHEADLDDLLSSEVLELARKREEEWRSEAEARDKLLNDVITECQERVNSRLKALKLMKSEHEEKYARLMNEVEAAKASSQIHHQSEKNNVEDGQPQIPSRTNETNNEYMNDRNELGNNFELVNEAPNSKSVEPPVPNHRRKTQLW
ncbi:hypothetical protein ACTXT7_000840 [Hymenolepis weldensis]